MKFTRIGALLVFCAFTSPTQAQEINICDFDSGYVYSAWMSINNMKRLVSYKKAELERLGCINVKCESSAFPGRGAAIQCIGEDSRKSQQSEASSGNEGGNRREGSGVRMQ